MAALEDFLRTWNPPSSWRGRAVGSLVWLYHDDDGSLVEFGSYGAHALVLLQQQVGAVPDRVRPTLGPDTWTRLFDRATQLSTVFGVPFDASYQGRDLRRGEITRELMRWALAIVFHRGRADRVVLPRDTELPAYNSPLPVPSPLPDTPLVARYAWRPTAPSTPGLPPPPPGPTDPAQPPPPPPGPTDPAQPPPPPPGPIVRPPAPGVPPAPVATRATPWGWVAAGVGTLVVAATGALILAERGERVAG